MRIARFYLCSIACLLFACPISVPSEKERRIQFEARNVIEDIVWMALAKHSYFNSIDFRRSDATRMLVAGIKKYVHPEQVISSPYRYNNGAIYGSDGLPFDVRVVQAPESGEDWFRISVSRDGKEVAFRVIQISRTSPGLSPR